MCHNHCWASEGARGGASTMEDMQPMSCFVNTDEEEHVCKNLNRSWFTHGNSNNYAWLALLSLVLYFLAFAPGLGLVPWTINFEIHVLQDMEKNGGIASTTNWVSNFVVAQMFMSLIDLHTLGPLLTFLLFEGLASLALVFVVSYLLKTKGALVRAGRSSLRRVGKLF